MAEGRTRGIARVACAVGLTAAMTLGGMPLAAVPAWAGSLQVNATQGNGNVVYDAYQVFSGTVTEKDGKKTISNVKWSGEAEKAAKSVFGKDYTGSTAQDAADYISRQMAGATNETIAAPGSFAARLAEALAKSGMTAPELKPGVANKDLADGYYLVVSDPASVKGSGAATAPVFALVGGGATVITEKASVPTLDKQVQEDSTGTFGHGADAQVGQPVSYRLTATLPKNLASYESYHLKFVDYLSGGLAYNGDAKITVTHADGKSEGLDGSSKAKVTHPYTGDDAADKTGYSAGQTVLAIDFANLKTFRTASGKAIQPTDKIVVDYTAKLTSAAIIGGTGNPNKAKLVYSNNPQTGGEGETKLMDPTVYTYQLNVRKRDADKAGVKGADRGLAGAKFTLRVKGSDGAADKDSAGKYVQGTGELGDGAYKFTSDSEGNVTIPCIDAGTYELVETDPPTGYSRMQGAATIQITSNRGEGGTLSVEATGTENGAAELEAAADKSTGQIDVVVRDTKNVGMPQTGSAGFAAMIAAGGSLVAVSLAALMRRRR